MQAQRALWHSKMSSVLALLHGTQLRDYHLGRKILSDMAEGMVSTMLCQPMLSTPDAIVLSHAGVQKVNRLWTRQGSLNRGKVIGVYNRVLPRKTD
jgi:hypothetical protein